jgi:hypothetical protein
MFGRVIGALVGRELDRRDGRGGLKGAAFGAVAAGAMRRMGPLGMVLGGAYVAKKALDRRRAMRRPL